MTSKYLYESIYDDLINKINNNEYPINSLLPKELELMKLYDASRFTIRQSLAKLEQENMIERVKGVGTYVRANKKNYPLSNMLSFTEIIKQQGGVPNSEILSINLLNKSTANIQNFFGQSEVCCVERIRKDHKTNLCYEKTYINVELCPDLPLLVKENVSIYELYENHYKLTLGSGHFNLEAIISDKKIADILEISENSPLLYMVANVYTIDNIPLYLVEAYYVGSRYIFSTQLNR